MPLSILGLRANKCLRKLCSDGGTNESSFKSRIEKNPLTGTLGSNVLEWGKNKTLSPFVDTAAGKIISEDGKIDPNALKSLNDIRKYLLKCIGTKKKGNFYKFFSQEITSANLKGARVRAEAYLKLVKNPQKSNDDSAESTTAGETDELTIDAEVEKEMKNKNRMKNKTAQEKWKKSHLDRLKILFALILIAVYERYQEQKDTTDDDSDTPQSDDSNITVDTSNLIGTANKDI